MVMVKGAGGSSSRSKPAPGQKGGEAASKAKGKGFKVIQKTVDLVKANDRLKSKGKGKGKEKEVLGHVADSLPQREKVLPGGIQVERFAEARALEILALQNAIKSAAALGSTRAFQSLPRHLRRRAASHNPRRVPKRYRSRAAAEIQPGDNVVKLHRKRAKLRAKGNLKGESRTAQLLERQRNKAWLPTHIWHAKRFHVTNIWGYRLPNTPTLKSFRPAYRAAARKAIVNDTSYFSTIELVGARNDILRLLSRVAVGQFAGTMYESGARVAHATLYADGTFPYGLIGPVDIIWKPEEDQTAERRVWLRIHPAIHSATLEILRQLLDSSDLVNHGASSSTSTRQTVQLNDLRGEIDSFEIMGPRATKVLRRILRLVKSEGTNKAKFFNSLATALSDEMPSDLVAGLLVHDPRLIFPAPVLPRREPELEEDGILRSSSTVEPSSTLATSGIWHSAIRDTLSTPRFKKSDLDRRRHKLGLPGTALRATSQDDRIPILLVQKSISSGTASDDHAVSGFTVLIPRGWLMYFLSSFVYAGCMIGGLVERRNQYREAGVASFPEHYGETCRAGREWQEHRANEERARWEKKPPAKRPQFAALGTAHPWTPDWATVMQPDDEEAALNGAQRSPWLLTSPLLPYIDAIASRTEGPAATLLKLVNAFRQQRQYPSLATDTADDLYATALLHVRLEVEGRGSPGDMAVIYALSSHERQAWLAAQEKDAKYGRADWDQEDPKREMQKLGEIVPDQKQTIGYTSTGNFSLARGQGFALATITLKGYLELRKEAGPEGVLVKVKNRDGRICRLARVEIGLA